MSSEGKFVQICRNTSSGSGPGIDWTGTDWWNRIDWRTRDYFRLDLIGAERLKEILRKTFEEDSGEDDDTASKERLEKLDEMTRSLAVKIRRMEKELKATKKKQEDEDEKHKKKGGRSKKKN